MTPSRATSATRRPVATYDEVSFRVRHHAATFHTVPSDRATGPPADWPFSPHSPEPSSRPSHPTRHYRRAHRGRCCLYCFCCPLVAMLPGPRPGILTVAPCLYTIRSLTSVTIGSPYGMDLCPSTDHSGGLSSCVGRVQQLQG
uniref:Uncharacterized protein n=1 Tax=Anopheles maculatus TaxID=74869 RepID=A0A182S851_9DIPT